MSDPRRAADPDEPAPPTGHGTEKGRRRARWLLPLIFLAVIALIVGYMLLVSQAGPDEDDGGARTGAPAVEVVLDVRG